jgi:hypothetical protein
MIALRADLSDLGYANISGDAGDRPLVEGVGGLGLHRASGSRVWA